MIATEPLQARPLAAGTDPCVCRVDGCGRAAETRGLCRAHYLTLMQGPDAAEAARLAAIADPPRARGPKSARPPWADCRVAGCAGRALKRGLCSRHYHRLQRSTDTAEIAALEAVALPSRRGHPGPRTTGGGARPPGAAQGRAAERGGLAVPECLVGVRGEGVERNGGAARPLSVGGFMLAPPTGRLTPAQEAERAALLDLYCRRTAEGSHIRTGEPLTAGELRSIDGGGIGPDERARRKMVAAGKARIAGRRAELVRLAGPDAEARLPELLRGVWREWAGGLSIRELAARVGLTLGAAATRLCAARRALGLPLILGDGRLAGGAA